MYGADQQETSGDSRRIRFDPTFSLGNLANLVSLLGAVVGVCIYVGSIDKGTATNATEIRALEARVARLEQDADRREQIMIQRLDRLENKIDAIMQRAGVHP